MANGKYENAHPENESKKGADPAVETIVDSNFFENDLHINNDSSLQ
jgi:hypothetical protein